MPAPYKRRTTNRGTAVGWAAETDDMAAPEGGTPGHGGNSRRTRARRTIVPRFTTRANPQDRLSVQFFDRTEDPEGVGIYKWVWSFYDGVQPTEVQGSIVQRRFPEPGTYGVTLTVTNRNEQSQSITYSVTVVGPTPPPPPPPEPSVPPPEPDQPQVPPETPEDFQVLGAPPGELAKVGPDLAAAAELEAQELAGADDAASNDDNRFVTRFRQTTFPADPETEPIVFTAGSSRVGATGGSEAQPYETTTTDLLHTWTLPDGTTQEGPELQLFQPIGQTSLVSLTTTDPNTGTSATSTQAVSTSPLTLAKNAVKTRVFPTDPLASNEYPYLSNTVQFEDITPAYPPGVTVRKRQWKIPGSEYYSVNPSLEYDITKPLPENEPRAAYLYLELEYTDPVTQFTDVDSFYVRVDVGHGNRPVDALIPDVYPRKGNFHTDVNAWTLHDRHVNTTAQKTTKVVYNLHQVPEISRGTEFDANGKVRSPPLYTYTGGGTDNFNNSPDIVLPRGNARFYVQQVVTTSVRTAYSFPPVIIETTDEDRPDDIFTGQGERQPKASFTAAVNFLVRPKKATLRSTSTPVSDAGRDTIVLYEYTIGTDANGQEVARPYVLNGAPTSLNKKDVTIETIDPSYEGTVPVTLTVTDAMGRTASFFRQIDFFGPGAAYNDPPKAELSYVMLTTNTVEVRDRSQPGLAPLDANFEVDFGDGTTPKQAATGTSILHRYDERTTGAVRITLTATDTDGNTDAAYANVAVTTPGYTAMTAPRLDDAEVIVDGLAETITVRGTLRPPVNAQAPDILTRSGDATAISTRTLEGPISDVFTSWDITASVRLPDGRPIFFEGQTATLSGGNQSLATILLQRNRNSIGDRNFRLAYEGWTMIRIAPTNASAETGIAIITVPHTAINRNNLDEGFKVDFRWKRVKIDNAGSLNDNSYAAEFENLTSFSTVPGVFRAQYNWNFGDVYTSGARTGGDLTGNLNLVARGYYDNTLTVDVRDTQPPPPPGGGGLEVDFADLGLDEPDRTDVYNVTSDPPIRHKYRFNQTYVATLKVTIWIQDEATGRITRKAGHISKSVHWEDALGPTCLFAAEVINEDRAQILIHLLHQPNDTTLGRIAGQATYIKPNSGDYLNAAPAQTPQLFPSGPATIVVNGEVRGDPNRVSESSRPVFLNPATGLIENVTGSLSFRNRKFINLELQQHWIAECRRVYGTAPNTRWYTGYQNVGNQARLSIGQYDRIPPTSAGYVGTRPEGTRIIFTTGDHMNNLDELDLWWTPLPIELKPNSTLTTLDNGRQARKFYLYMEIVDEFSNHGFAETTIWLDLQGNQNTLQQRAWLSTRGTAQGNIEVTNPQNINP